jgi:hypothetical protein
VIRELFPLSVWMLSVDVTCQYIITYWHLEYTDFVTRDLIVIIADLYYFDMTAESRNHLTRQMVHL